LTKLSVKGLVKSYRKARAVDSVTVDVRQGEIVGLLGPNGAGKTTTFHMIVGLIAPDEGGISLDNKDITGLPMYERARCGISYLPQEPSVFRKLTVEENIRAVLEFTDMTGPEIKERTEVLLDEFGIGRLRGSKAYSLSGGERRRVEIARALVNDPMFLLLDEPFSGIDPIAVADIQGVLLGLKAKGIGLLITDHNVGATLGICDRAYIIEKGRLLKHGTPDEILGSEKVREAYLGANFRL
jgi:lipopolysaccharide export system ATP-binding protein